MWAEAMEIYKSGDYKLTLSKNLQKELIKLQAKYTPEDPMERTIPNNVNLSIPRTFEARMGLRARRE